MDQTGRYVDLSLDEDELIEGGQHILCAYKLRPKPGVGYLEAAAAFAAESSTGTNVEVCTTDDFTKGIDAVVYRADESTEDVRLAFPLVLFDRNITDGRMMLVSFLTLTIGNNQGMGDIEYAKMYDFLVPRAALSLFDGPTRGIADLWRILGRPVVDGGYIAGTIVKPKLGLRPEPFARAAHDFWLGGDFIKNDEPQGNQVFAPMRQTIPLVVDAMRRAMDETGEAKLFSANITADDPREMVARGEFVLQAFGPDADKVAFLVDGFVGGPAAVTTARRTFPSQFLHFHRAGHGMVTSAQSRRGYTAYVLAKMARLQGASGMHVGTLGHGKMEGTPADRMIAYVCERDVAEGPAYIQEWYGMRPTAPIVSGGMNALRLPGFFDDLGHANIISTAGGGCYGHVDGPAAGARSLRQAYECWDTGADPVEWASTHREFARAFESFPDDADALYPGWRTALGH
ncbi:MAG: ribulose-bisphosphate carboxylase [Actinomyces sp.]|jgi:ribulose-bisphosphate carboxylase large chain|nr:ribulose-bisphosphate carboxylase [Actinomyces sp.]MCI1642368.1 ribulose-bisphosphate carboxylase [Actinomyces sp.]MCI1662664.1 ribulose-bisphosphate carboxylase [Actinomyces sp.]MCI1691513.1 ribulose-bisphosphate carboxylase [Actinomyces sp.]